jgi:S-ribosylhomocysteine lyase LuxS involved in autoinducer biosynthesis
LRRKLKQRRVIPKMPKPSVAVIAQHAANFAGHVIVVYDQRFLRPTNNAFMCGGFQLLQFFVRNNRTKLASTVCVSVCSTALTAPAI